MKQKSLGVNALLNGIKQCCSIIFPLITFPYISRVLGSDALAWYDWRSNYDSLGGICKLCDADTFFKTFLQLENIGNQTDYVMCMRKCCYWSNLHDM